MMTMTMIMTFTNPTRDRQNLAKWLALIPPAKAEAILARHGAASLRRLHPGHFVSVLNAIKAERAKASGHAQGRVSLFSLADTIHATVDNIRRRDVEATVVEEREREERVAPLRAAVVKAESAYAQACSACDDAQRERKAKYRAMIQASQQREAAREKVAEADNRPLRILGNGRFAEIPFLEQKYDSAVAAYRSGERVLRGGGCGIRRVPTL
jgi:hypothetical protein